jgi:hypothetical protein
MFIQLEVADKLGYGSIECVRCPVVAKNYVSFLLLRFYMRVMTQNYLVIEAACNHCKQSLLLILVLR